MKTLGGSIKALQNSWSDLQKEMGKSAAPGLTAGFKAIAKTLSQSQEAFDALAVPILVFYKDLENAGRIIGISVGAAWNTVEVSVIKGAKAAVDALVYLQHAKEEFVGGEPSTFYLGLLETQRDLKVAVMDAESAMKDEGSMLDQIIASNETYRESIANIYEGEQQLFRQRAEAAAAASAAPTTPEDPEAAAAAVEKALANAKVVEDALADANDAAYEKELDATDEHFKRIETSRKQHTKNQISIAQGWMSYLVQATAEGAKQNREMFEANKALSMANIVVSTASGIMRAWMDLPWYAALPMTGIIAAAGISQLATVQATKFGGGGGSISSGGGGAGGVGGGGTSASGGGGTGGGGRDVNLTIVGDSISTEQVREIMERISDESDDGTRIRVNE